MRYRPQRLLGFRYDQAYDLRCTFSAGAARRRAKEAAEAAARLAPPTKQQEAADLAADRETEARRFPQRPNRHDD